MLSSAQASVTAVGSPRATSVAKLGPERIAGVASGSTSATISVMNLCVPRSMPLAQATTGTPLATCALQRGRGGAQFLRRHHEKHGVGVRRIRDGAGRGNTRVELDAGQTRALARRDQFGDGRGIARPQASRRGRRAHSRSRAPFHRRPRRSR